MRRTFLRISVLVLLAACSSDDDKEAPDLSLLTGSTQKTWYMYDETPEDENESCRPTSAFHLDNSWIFFADGSFEFDHGDLTEDAECQEDGCCSDIVNATGSWESTNDGKGLKIIVDHEKGNPDGWDPVVLVDGTIELLDEDQLKITQVVDGVERTVEFREK